MPPQRAGRVERGCPHTGLALLTRLFAARVGVKVDRASVGRVFGHWGSTALANARGTMPLSDAEMFQDNRPAAVVSFNPLGEVVRLL